MPSARTLSGESLANAIYAITDKLEEQFVEEFILQARKLSRGKSLQQLLDQIEGGYFTSIASIPPALSLIKINTSKLDAIVRKAIGSSARITNQKVGLNLSFNVRNPKIIETARNISVELSTNLSKTSQQIIDKVIANAMEGLVTRREAIKIIESRVGLLPAHSDAVDRYYDTLIQSGSTKAMAKKLADKYADRLLKYRANTIARTEIARATGIGQTEFWRQAMDEGVFSKDTKRVWSTGYDELVCDICGPMNKVEVGIFEQWLTPNGFVDYPSAIHPNCRCSQGIALSASQKRMFVGKSDAEQFDNYVLSKFNPYHDELGRFTFASGGRRVSAMPNGKKTPTNIKLGRLIIEQLDENKYGYQYGEDSFEVDFETYTWRTREGDDGEVIDSDSKDLKTIGGIALIEQWSYWEGNFAIRTICSEIMGLQMYAAGGDEYDDDDIDALRGYGNPKSELPEIYVPATHAMMEAVVASKKTTYSVSRAMVVRGNSELLLLGKGSEITMPLSGFSPYKKLVDEFGLGGSMARSFSEDVITPVEKEVIFVLKRGAKAVEPYNWEESQEDGYEFIEYTTEQGALKGRKKRLPFEIVTQGKFKVVSTKDLENGVEITIEHTEAFNIKTGKYEKV